MKFNLTYGPDIANAPDGFKATVEAVAAFFESTFTDPVTINVKVERGLSGGLLGHSDYALTGPYTFAQITTALAQETHSGSDVIALAHLPTVDPISGTHAYYMTSAQAKALGLQAPATPWTAPFNSRTIRPSTTTAATGSRPDPMISMAPSHTSSRR